MFRFEDTYWWFVARRHLIVSMIEQFYPDARSAQRRSNGMAAVAGRPESGVCTGTGRPLRILDIGCGTGAMLDQLAPFGHVVGADFAEEALAFSRSRGSGHPLARTDIRCLPFRSNSFDIVTAMDVVEHIDNDKAAMCEITRVLRPGGRVFVTVPAYQFLWSDHDVALHHYRRYTTPAVKDLFQRVGLRMDKLTYSVTGLLPAAWAYRMLVKLLKPRDAEPKAHLVRVPEPANGALISILRLETRALSKINLPFGLTVACVAQKEGTPREDIAETDTVADRLSQTLPKPIRNGESRSVDRLRLPSASAQEF